MKLVYILPGIFIVIIIGLVIFENFFQPSYLCSSAQKFRESGYRGVVFKKFIDSDNHATRTLLIKTTNSKFYTIFLRDTSGFFEYTKAGDSIFKVKNRTDLQVIRQSKSENFDIYWGCK